MTLIRGITMNKDYSNQKNDAASSYNTYELLEVLKDDLDVIAKVLGCHNDTTSIVAAINQLPENFES
jgi:hypothetical protein